MIHSDQPNNFEDSVIAAVSSTEDGQMQHGWSEADEDVNANREAFLLQNGLTMDSSVLVRVRYLEDASYDVIRDVGIDDAGVGMFKAEGEATDCLVTNTPGLGLFLPVADCIATIVHDPINRVVAMAHLGRHSTIVNLASKLIVHFESKYGSDPKNLKIWMSPSIKKTNYFLKTADFAVENPQWFPYLQKTDAGYAIDIQGYNKARFMEEGVPEEQIIISSVDTASDQNYWSHYTSRTVNGGSAPPRFAAVVALKAD
jgi:copper oxidase (laccase) domain-containing protein